MVLQVGHSRNTRVITENKSTFIVFIHSFLFVCRHVCHGIPVKGSQQFGGVSSLHHVGPREGIQVIREGPFRILPSLVINF